MIIVATQQPRPASQGITGEQLAESARIVAETDNGWLAEDIEQTGEEPSECPVCGGPGVLLGQLGRRVHHRCRDCGMDFSATL
jgi:hypothetical protein